MDNSQLEQLLEKVLQQDYSAGTEEFRDELLKRCLAELNANAGELSLEADFPYVESLSLDAVSSVIESLSSDANNESEVAANDSSSEALVTQVDFSRTKNSRAEQEAQRESIGIDLDDADLEMLAAAGDAALLHDKGEFRPIKPPL